MPRRLRAYIQKRTLVLGPETREDGTGDVEWTMEIHFERRVHVFLPSQAPGFLGLISIMLHCRNVLRRYVGGVLMRRSCMRRQRPITSMHLVNEQSQ